MEDYQNSGVLILDKPPGITSAGAVARVKRLTGVSRVGHAGTLDPLATGVLVCATNQATRLCRFFLAGRKTYEAVLTLGQETDTQDAAGSPVGEPRPVTMSAEAVGEAFSRFRGNFLQQPPAFSALKQDGVPLYRLARRGTPVQKPPREVTVFELRIDEIRLPDVRFTVSCSAGTYVRSLCADIGRTLDCGGHLKSLRRLKSGLFTLEQAVGLGSSNR